MEKKREQNRGREVSVEGYRFKVEKMVPTSKRKAGNEMKVVYTIVKGVTSALTELNDYLWDNELFIMGIVETKLCDAIVPLEIDEGKYNVWRKDREKQGG